MNETITCRVKNPYESITYVADTPRGCSFRDGLPRDLTGKKEIMIYLTGKRMCVSHFAVSFSTIGLVM